MKKLISFSLFAMIVLLVLVARAADAQTIVQPRGASVVVVPLATGPGCGVRLHCGWRHHRHMGIGYSPMRPVRARRYRW
jgi:hypothetical protein